MRKRTLVLLAVLSLAWIASVTRVHGAQNLKITKFGHDPIIRTYEPFKVWLVVVNNNTSGMSYVVEVSLDEGIYPTVMTENGFVDGSGSQTVYVSLTPKTAGNHTIEVRLYEGSNEYWLDSASENVNVGKGDLETKVDSLTVQLNDAWIAWISLGVLGIIAIILAVASVWLAAKKRKT